MRTRTESARTTRRFAHDGAVARGLLLACHLGPTLAVTAFAVVIALAVGTPARTAVLVGAAVLAGQLSVGWSNDWIDARRDIAVARSDKPVAAGLVSAEVVRAAALVAAAACVPLSLALGWRAGVVHLAAVASAWLYNAWLKSTAWSWAPYAFSFGLLPSVATLTLPGYPFAPGWVTAAAALLGVGAHLANVAPDLVEDRATGVHGLGHRIGRTATGALAAGALLGATVVVVLGLPGPPEAWAWAGLLVATALAGAGAVITLRSPTSRLPFATSLALAAVDVTLLAVAGSSLV